MNDLLIGFKALAGRFPLEKALQALVILALGFVVSRLAGAAVRRILEGRATIQQAIVARRITLSGIFGVACLAALNQLGFDLSVLLGAAGVLTVALGFASQTAASNLISGLFLLGERPFVAGDVIKVGETMGEVVNLSLLSMTLRTFDNLAVRIPNEALLKSEITNYTRFPLRRVDIEVPVAYRSDLGHVRRVLDAVAAALPQCLDEPQPLFFVRSFADSAVVLQYSVWAQRDNYLPVATALRQAILEAFRREDIEIPFPQQVVHNTVLPGSPLRPEAFAMADSIPPRSGS
jgi:small-conductance mechanosensitive channel